MAMQAGAPVLAVHVVRDASRADTASVFIAVNRVPVSYTHLTLPTTPYV